MQITGFKVRQSEKAMGFVCTQDVRDNVGILWIPMSKIAKATETDYRSRKIVTNKGTFMGCPMILDVDSAFMEKLGLA